MMNLNGKRTSEYVEKYNFISGLPNVELNFGAVEETADHPLEQVYLHGIFKALSGHSTFSDLKFYVISANAPWDFEINEECIVFYMSNEDHEIPERILKAFLVFTPYCPLNDKPANVFPIPLGYNGSLLDLKIKPIKDRTIDVFFSGNLHRRRLEFFLAARLFLIRGKILGSKHNVKVSFGRQFGGGLPADKYSEVLMDSKIALVPEGYLSNNSFRFFEASKYGVIIITKKLYEHWFYRSFPGYQLNTWFGFGRKVRKLLKHPEKMSQLQLATLKYYEENCSEKEVANYIISKIIEKSN